MTASDNACYDRLPRRVGEFWFKPHQETVWPSPDADVDRGTDPLVLMSFVSAYNTLLTHPCGLEMLREARREWKTLAKKEGAHA